MMIATRSPLLSPPFEIQVRREEQAALVDGGTILKFLNASSCLAVGSFLAIFLPQKIYKYIIGLKLNLSNRLLLTTQCKSSNIVPDCQLELTYKDLNS